MYECPFFRRVKNGEILLNGLPGCKSLRQKLQTLLNKQFKNVRSRFRHIIQDNGVLVTFQFLVNLAISSREENPQERLLDIGIDLPDSPTPLSVTKAVNAYVAPKRDSFEYSETELVVLDLRSF